MTTHYIRRDGNRVIERGNGATPEWLAERNKLFPGQYLTDDGTTALTPPVPPPPPVLVPNDYPSVEELTDAFLKFADGDRSGLNAIRARRAK